MKFQWRSRWLLGHKSYKHLNGVRTIKAPQIKIIKPSSEDLKLKPPVHDRIIYVSKHALFYGEDLNITIGPIHWTWNKKQQCPIQLEICQQVVDMYG